MSWRKVTVAMNQVKCLPLFFLLAAVLFAADPALRTRTDVQDDYRGFYLTSAVTASELAWTGSVASCNPGTISALADTRLLQRINYFRRLCGLRDSVTLDAVKNSKCQDMALISDARDSLSHFPPSSWACYTATGAEAGANSNLSLGNHSVNAVTGQMRDDGTGNTAAGHRRWILFSRARTFGHGSTTSAMALWVLGNSGNPIPAGQPAFTAYPPAGFMPAPLVYSRWSFGIPAADFRSAAVTMKYVAGGSITIAQEPVSHNSYGDNTIVWRPSGISLSGPGDVVCSVFVSGVLSAPQASYAYQVCIFQPVTTDREAGIAGKGAPEELVCAPNPFFTSIRFACNITDPAGAVLAIHDPAGRLVKRVALSGAAPGLRTAALDAADFPAPGIYTCVVSRKGHRVSRRFAFMR